MNIIIEQKGEDQEVRIINNDSLLKRLGGMIKGMFHFSLNRRNFIVLAITLLCFISGSAVYSYLNRPPMEIRFYNKYYNPLKGASTHYFIESTAFEKAKKKYFEGEQDIAWLLLENIPDSSHVILETTFYKGLILMEMERHKEAIQYFNSLIQSPEYLSIYGITNWYLGLCYLKTGDFGNAKNSFIKLTNNNSTNHQKAEKILKALKKKS
jgi:tetratricopeptide (TPR) repeat protein